jgi:hypothetical protein
MWACADISELQLLAPATSFCSAKAPLACAVGDLSGKNYAFAGLNSASFEYIDVNLPLKGSRSVIGRSVVIEDNYGNPIACANIVAVKSLVTPSPTNFPTFPFGPALPFYTMAPAPQPTPFPSQATPAPREVEALQLVFTGGTSLQPSPTARLVRLVGDSLGVTAYSSIRVTVTPGDQLTAARRQLFTAAKISMQPSRQASSDPRMTVEVELPSGMVDRKKLLQLGGQAMDIINLEDSGIELIKVKYAPKGDGVMEVIYIDRY